MFSWLDECLFHKSRKIRLILLMERNPTPVDMVNIPSFARFCTSKRCLLEISSEPSTVCWVQQNFSLPGHLFVPRHSPPFPKVSQEARFLWSSPSNCTHSGPHRSPARGSDHWEMLQQRWKINHFLWKKRVELFFLDIFCCYCPS